MFVLAIAISLVTAVFSQQRIRQVKSAADKLNEEYCTGLFKMVDGTYFDLLEDRINVSAQGYRNILDWLQGRVAGLQVYRTYDDRSIAFIRNQRASIFVDEINVTEDFLNALPVSDIAMIKIIKDPVLSGWRGPGGVIAIYTIHGDDEEEDGEE